MESSSHYIIKIVLLGEANVGKTSLVYRFIEDKFRENYKSTLGVNLLKKEMNIDKYGEVSAQIWDLGGQESFKSLRKLYLERANAGMLVYDCTKKKTFDKLDGWIQDFKQARGNEPLVLIGNKNDLSSERKIYGETAIQLAEELNLEYFETSALTGDNVKDVFKGIATKLLHLNK